MHCSTRPLLASSLILLTLFVSASAHATAAVENGQVVIGEPADGPDLARSNVPSQPLLVTVDSPYEVFSRIGTLIHVAAWTTDGLPARDAAVYFEGRLVGRTDATGTLVFRWGVPGDGAAYWLDGGDIAVRWDQGGTLYGGDVSFSARPRTGSFASDQVFVYTDRGVYNPGDDILIRALGWHLAADYSPLEAADIEFLLTDPQGRVVAGADGQTDDFGVASLQLPVSPHADEGVYTLTARYEDAEAVARLRIERFTPPVIRIEHTLGRFLTLSQPELAFEVTLGYFTDAEFSGGQLAIDVLVEGASRYRAEQAVTGPGPHVVSVDREALSAIRAGLGEGALVEVEIEATDIHGRRDDVTRELEYTRNPYIVVIEKDRDYYSPDDPVELIVRLSDRDRVPVRNTEVTLSTSAGRQLTATSDDAGTVQFSLTMPDHELRVEVLLADVGSPVATARLPLQGAQPMRSHIADAIVRENDAARIRITFPSHFMPVESVVHVDVVDYSGALVQSVLVPIHVEDGQYIAEDDFVAPSWGSMLLTLFCLGRDVSSGGAVAPGQTALGLMTEGQNLAVHPGRELQIELDGVPDVLEPGASFAGQVLVRDAAGNPIDAAVGAAVVDAAVISLKDPLEITPMDHFYNPRLRVLSTTGSAILTWPVVSRNWGGSRHDVALPPFPYREGGRVDGIFDGERKVHFGENTDADLVDEDALAMGPHGDAYSLIGEYGMERLAATVAEAPPVITIRTEFPETSLWSPTLEAVGGRAHLSGRLPDAITTQQITLVASDRRGGVGVLRVPVRVTQPLFVQADLPDELTVGDQVEATVVVQNHGDHDETVEVTFASDQLGVAGAVTEIEVPANGSAAARFPIEAHQAGPVSLVVTARAGRQQDLVERVAFVRPLGLPDRVIQSQTITGGAPAELTVTVPSDGQLTTLDLNVAFPAVSAGFAGLEAIRTELSARDTVSMGGEILSTALLYRFQKERGGDPVELAAMRAAIDSGLAYLLSAQRPDGGWGFWWNRDSNAWVTAYCLDILSELDDLELTVPREALRRAVNHLAETHIDGLWDTTAVAFWEGDTEAVRLGLSAEVFSVLTRVPSRGRTPAWRRAIEVLGPRFEAYLDDLSPDPLTYAHSVLGVYHAAQAGVLEVSEERLAAAAARLNDLRQGDYWEPSWFNAYGGTIEATVVALQVYESLGRADVLAAEQRAAVRYLLSTRDEWGGWHNPRGTAFAIRGLLLLDPGVETDGARVVVEVDGREVRRVDIDPADPFMSAAELRALDLTPFIRPGETHVVRVRYDGALEPDAGVVLRHWRSVDELAHSAVRLTAELTSDEVGVDEVSSYQLQVSSTTGEDRLVRIELAAPSNAELDAGSLDEMVERGLIDGYEAIGSGYRLTLGLQGHSRRTLDLRLVGRWSGQAVVPVAVAQVLRAGARETEGLAVAMIDGDFVVR